MTLIVGIIARDAIVFGADSQTTYGETKDLGTRKLHQFLTANDVPILVGESGHETPSNQFVVAMRSLARTTAIETREDFFGLVTACRRVVNDEIVRTKAIAGFAEDFEILVGGFINGFPVLINCQMTKGLLEIVKPYVVIGDDAGCDVCRYALQQAFGNNQALVNESLAAAYAIYAVFQGKGHSRNIGGDINVGVISMYDGRDGGHFFEQTMLPRGQIEAFTKIVAETSDEVHNLINAKLTARFHAIMDGLFRRNKGNEES